MQTERLGWAGNLAAVESNLNRHCVVTQAYPLGRPLGYPPHWAKGSVAWVEKNKAFIAFERGDHLFPEAAQEETVDQALKETNLQLYTTPIEGSIVTAAMAHNLFLKGWEVEWWREDFPDVIHKASKRCSFLSAHDGMRCNYRLVKKPQVETPKEPTSKGPALLKVIDKKSPFFGLIRHAGFDNGWWGEHEMRRNIEEGWLAPVDPMTEPLMVGDTVQVVFESSPFKGKIGKITRIKQEGCVVVEGCTETDAGWKRRSSLKLISRGEV